MNYQYEAFPKGQSEPRSTKDTEAEYGFLVGSLLDRETLIGAIATGLSWGVDPHEVLIARGWISEDSYVEALARHLGLRALSHAHAPLEPEAVLLDGRAGTPWQVARSVAEGEASGRVVVLASSRVILDRGSAEDGQRRIQRAISGLLQWRPVLSAGMPTWTWQLLAIAMIIGLVTGQVFAAPDVAHMTLLLMLTLAFLPVVVLRLAITALGLFPAGRSADPHRIPDADLPVYSVLVPMFQEGAVLPDLVAALSALDYPAAKLDVLLVLESVDAETQNAAASLDLPGFMRVIVVPDSQPRTKPKALNYALQFARGDYVVVYDAEDAPEPDQLRRAIATFAESPAATVCLQGRLNIHNACEGWLTSGIMAQTPLEVNPPSPYL